jgi:tRNA threonylcarbamoyl adenosine modification protein YjeE
VFESDSAAATEAVGAALARELRDGDVVFLTGELGAGKTTLVRGAARALGCDAPVTSPTFALGHRYPAGADLLVTHLDLYRLASLDAEDPELLAPYLGPRSESSFAKVALSTARSRCAARRRAREHPRLRHRDACDVRRAADGHRRAVRGA